MAYNEYNSKFADLCQIHLKLLAECHTVSTQTNQCLTSHNFCLTHNFENYVLLEYQNF